MRVVYLNLSQSLGIILGPQCCQRRGSWRWPWTFSSRLACSQRAVERLRNSIHPGTYAGCVFPLFFFPDITIMIYHAIIKHHSSIIYNILSYRFVWYVYALSIDLFQLRRLIGASSPWKRRNIRMICSSQRRKQSEHYSRIFCLMGLMAESYMR